MQSPDLLCKRFANCLSTVSHPLIYFFFCTLICDAEADLCKSHFRGSLASSPWLGSASREHRGRFKVGSRANGPCDICYSCSITLAMGPDSNSQLLSAQEELASSCSLTNKTSNWAVTSSWRSEH